MICGRVEGRCHRRGKSFLVVGPTIHIIRASGKKLHVVSHLTFSLSLSLSSVPFQIGERITMELIITDVLSVLSVNRGIVSRENRGNFVIRQTRI